MSLNEGVYFHREMSLEEWKLESWRHDCDFTHPSYKPPPSQGQALRKHQTYLSKCGVFDKTRPAKINIGERRKPAPEGCSCYLRVDSVHQGDLDRTKGDAVDETAQFQVIFAVKHISEAYLLLVLAAMIDTFPLVIRRLHSDNGSEYINHKVAKLLEKLRIE